MASKKKALYDGPDGNVNLDVARSARKGSRMKHGEVYEVDEALFDGLMLHGDWKPAEGFEDDAKKAREASAEEARLANVGASEGTDLETLLKQQEEAAQRELEESGATQQEAEAPAQTPARGRRNTPPAPENGGGDNS